MSRRTLGAFGLVLVTLQPACMPLEPGRSGVSDELARRQGQSAFSVISASPARTVFAAKGRQVVVAPTDGFCVAADSLDVSGSAAFALIADCGSTNMPRGFPAVMTVSVSGGPLADPGKTTGVALGELEAFLTGGGGTALLGRSPGSRDVRVIGTRRVGDGLYVLVEDSGRAPVPGLGTRFWRAFVELGGRMCMVTLSGLHEAPMPDEEMLAFLVRQVVAMRQANRAAPSADELQMAQAVDPSYTIAGLGREAEFDDEGSGDAVAETDGASGAAAAQSTTAAPSTRVASAPAKSGAAGPGAAAPEPAAAPAVKTPATSRTAASSPAGAGYAGRSSGDTGYRGPGTPAAEAPAAGEDVGAEPAPEPDRVGAAPRAAAATAAAYAPSPASTGYQGRSEDDTTYKGPAGAPAPPQPEHRG